MTGPGKIKLINEEIEFKYDQLFFSITDKKGVIELNNDVFSQVCGYSKSQLKGQPHNIIRHPDMPKFIFKMLWDTIQNGKPFGCYLKNLAASGKHYWVYALVLPVGDRYLSIRLKASAAQILHVENLYRQISEGEAISENIVSSILNQWLWRRQFPDYYSWMSHSLNLEIKRRPPSMWQYHFFGREKPAWHIKEVEINPAVANIYDHVWINVQNLNKTFGEFFAKNEIVTKHFKNFEKLLSDYYDLISKTFNDVASDGNTEPDKLNNLLIEGSFYTDLRNYITTINNIGHTYQFQIDSFNLHTKMLDLYIKDFFNTLGKNQIVYSLFVETIDGILVLAKSIANCVEHFKKEQINFDQEAKKVTEFSTYLNQKLKVAREKYKPYHAHLSVNSEMIKRHMEALTNEIKESIADFIKAIEFSKGVILELEAQRISA